MNIDILQVGGFKVVNMHVKEGLSSFGIAAVAGCQYEEPRIAGIAHFAEHMFFKGTKNRPWFAINREFARFGAKQNAYTGNNEVLYYAGFPDEGTQPVIELMMDMFFNSSLPQDEMEKERAVILEEKKRSIDDPTSFFYSNIGESFFTWQRGHDTVGTFESIKAIQRDDITAYLNKCCNYGSVVFFYVGDCDNEDLARYIEGSLPSSPHPYMRIGDFDRVHGNVWSDTINTSDRVKLLVNRENMQQSQIAMVIEGLPTGHPQQYALRTLVKALGGGMYSRLFSRIREELGLCYSVGMYADFLTYPHCQTLNIYGGTSPENVKRFIDESEKLLDDVVLHGIDIELFTCAKMDMISSLLMATETSMGKMQYFSQPYLFGIPLTVGDILAKIKAVKIEDCNNVAKQILAVQHNWAVMNPAEK